MRVIAGTARSLPLKTIEGLETRPTTDRIKETLFNMLTGYVPQAKFLDLFAAACIEDNLKFTKLADKAQVRKFDAVSFVSSLPEIDYDVIFMDPPYSKGLERRVLEVLSTKKFTTDTLIVVEAALDEDFSYVDALGFEITKDKHYKTNKHVFLMQKENV